jgi:hypothetical protein
MKEVNPIPERRIKALEEDFMAAKTEIKQLMLDIRAMVMEASSPLKGQPLSGKPSSETKG